MIAHVVLFRPRPDLSDAARRHLADAFTTALREIPSLRRARIGRRVTIGSEYERLSPPNLTHAAILEFDDVEGLWAYLRHPAHAQVGQLFFETFEETLIYDFDLLEGEGAISALV
jgi:hypothetical protein